MLADTAAQQQWGSAQAVCTVCPQAPHSSFQLQVCSLVFFRRILVAGAPCIFCSPHTHSFLLTRLGWVQNPKFRSKPTGPLVSHASRQTQPESWACRTSPLSKELQREECLRASKYHIHTWSGEEEEEHPTGPFPMWTWHWPPCHTNQPEGNRRWHTTESHTGGWLGPALRLC